jgi:dienelactone hydrolase
LGFWPALILVAVLTAAPRAPFAFDFSATGGPGSNAPAELYQPAGAGPFAAVVVLHGCDGVGRHYRDWAERVASWGYVALLVDSFRPRGVRTVCMRGREVPPELRARDAHEAAQYLRGRADVRGDRIGVIGFSHGGWTVLKAVLADPTWLAPFAAAVAFYPGCEAPRAPLITDTLILIGDDWTPPRRCLAWRDSVRLAGGDVEIVVYPGALHGFDSHLAPHQYAGHRVGRDPAAAEASIAATRRFLARDLGR